MLNARMVNAKSSYFLPATFCEKNRIFGRILRFQNPFKYICNSQINPDTVHSVPVGESVKRNFRLHG